MDALDTRSYDSISSLKRIHLILSGLKASSQVCRRLYLCILHELVEKEIEQLCSTGASLNQYQSYIHLGFSMLLEKLWGGQEDMRSTFAKYYGEGKIMSKVEAGALIGISKSTIISQ